MDFCRKVYCQSSNVDVDEMFSPAAASGRLQRSLPRKHLQCGDNTCPPCLGGKRDSAVKEIESWWREGEGGCPGTADDLRKGECEGGGGDRV